LIGHTASVTSLDAVYVTGGGKQGGQLCRSVVVTSSVDSSVRIWRRDSGQGLLNLHSVF